MADPTVCQFCTRKLANVAGCKTHMGKCKSRAAQAPPAAPAPTPAPTSQASPAPSLEIPVDDTIYELPSYTEGTFYVISQSYKSAEIFKAEYDTMKRVIRTISDPSGTVEEYANERDKYNVVIDTMLRIFGLFCKEMKTEMELNMQVLDRKMDEVVGRLEKLQVKETP